MVTENKRMQQRRRTAAQWTSENPVLAAGEVGTIVDGTNTVAFKIGNGTTAWNSLPGPIDAAVLPELVAGLAVVLTPSGSWPTATTTIAVDLIDEDSFASDSATRPPSQQSVKAYADGMSAFLDYVVNQYYFNCYDSPWSGNAYSINTVYYTPSMLRAGTIDRIGIEVTTAGASGIVRLGIYGDTAGYPGTLIAEAASTADVGTTGVKDLTISATIPANGVYWFASANQTTVCSVQHGGRGLWVPLPLGTSAPSGSTGPKSRTQSSVTGALPSTASASTTSGGSSHGPRIHFRYSA